MEVNIKTYHIIYSMSHDFNPKNHCISVLYMGQSLKVTILLKTSLLIILIAYYTHHFLSLQTDFISQKSEIEELISK